MTKVTFDTAEHVEIPAMEKIDEVKILREQMWLLSEWNKKNIAMEPEQVRRNVETIIGCVNALR